MTRFLTSEGTPANLEVALANGGSVQLQPAAGGSSGGAIFLTEPTIAALEGAAVAGFQTGQPAAVESNGSLWSLTAKGALTVDHITVASSPDSSLVWQRWGSYVLEATAAQADVYIDAAVGNDEHTGALGSPLKTFAEWQRRMGGAVWLNLPTDVNVHLAGSLPSSDALNVGIVGPGLLTIFGTLTRVATGLPLTAFTPLNTGTGAMPHVNSAGHAWIAGQIVHDTTQGLSWCVISDLGGGTSEISTPFTTPVLTFPTRGTPVNGDSLDVFTPSDLYIDSAQAAQFQGVILQNVRCLTTIPSGNAAIGPLVAIVESTVDCFVLGTAGQSQVSLTSCFCTSNSAFVASVIMFGGAVDTGAGNIYLANSFFDFDVSMNDSVNNDTYVGQSNYGSVHYGSNGWPTPEHAAHGTNFFTGPLFDAQARLWGPFTQNVGNGCLVTLHATTAAATLLATGGLQLDGVATGWTWDSGTNAFDAGVALTPAAVDVAGVKGLQNPQTQAAFRIV